VPFLVGKAHDLVLDRRAIAWPARLDLSGIHRRAVQVSADQLVYRFIGVGNVANELLLRDAFRGKAEGRGSGVAWLHFRFREINGSAIDSARRSGLEAGQLEAARLQAVAQRLRGLVPCPAPFGLAFTSGMHERFQKRAGCQHNRPRTIKRIATRHHARRSVCWPLVIRFAVLEHQGFDNLLPQRQIRLSSTRCFIVN